MSENKQEYKEYSLAKIKKKNAEYLTPKTIIEMIHKDIDDHGVDKVAIDVCCGSGGLSFGLKCKEIFGVEFNPDACKVARQNGYEILEGDYFDFDGSNQKKYDCVISNPPFGLPREEKHKGVYDLYKTKSGVLDPYFVRHSFEFANYEGYYVLFCGLLYRRQEKWFRQWLLDNNLIDKLGMTKPNLFAETSIAVIILKLKKNRTTTTVHCIDADGFESDVDVSEGIKDDYTIRIPERPKEQEEINIEQLNKQINEMHAKYVENHNKCNDLVDKIERGLNGEIIPEFEVNKDNEKT